MHVTVMRYSPTEALSVFTVSGAGDDSEDKMAVRKRVGDAFLGKSHSTERNATRFSSPL